jgi:drug/metabolite transporter (DMT)-like permease
LFYGIVLGLIATVLYNAGFVLEKRALRDLPPLSMRRIGRLVWLLATSKAWLTGFLVMGMGMACQVVVMSLVPLSVAQPIQLAGLALLVVFSAVFLGERTTQREWAGLGVLALSFLLVCLSMEPTRLGLHAGTGTMLAVVSGTVLLGLAAFVTAARSGSRSGRPIPGLLYGAASGLLYGAAGLQTKGVSGFLAENPHHFVGRSLTSPYPYLYLVLSGAGLLLFQTALQRGRASIVVPVSSVVGAVYTVLAGTAVFGEPLPQDPVRLVLRSVGFGAAIIVVAFMPTHDEELASDEVSTGTLVPDRVV